MHLQNSTEFMKQLDNQYRAATGLDERRFYSIFYSKVNPSPVLLLGYNPGGDPSNWDVSQLASQSYFEKNEHEYVDCHYPIAKAMRTFLSDVLALQDYNEIRSIPKTNLIFRRSSSQDGVQRGKAALIQEAKPIVDQMINRVQPEIIVCEGLTTLNEFEKHYCTQVEHEIDGVEITTPNGRNKARIYRADRATYPGLSKPLTIIGIGHPSRYSSRREWGGVIGAAKTLVTGLRQN